VAHNGSQLSSRMAVTPRSRNGWRRASLALLRVTGSGTLLRRYAFLSRTISDIPTMLQLTLLVAVLVLSSVMPGAGQRPDSGKPAEARVAPGGLRPGDQIRLRIWREPDLSGDFTVDQQGVVVLPRIGPIQVQDRPPDSLRSYLRTAFATYLRNPSVDVTILRKVTIDGAVGKPGVYYLDPTITVAQAIALAEGASPEGKKDEVQLIRPGQDRALALKLPRSAKIAETPLRSGDRLYVPQRSWLSRNSGLVVGATISGLALILATLVTK
jgi:polysaccharide biosynthesis/export protein